MNSKYSVILAILIVLTAMSAAGCTTTTSPAATTTPAASQAPATSATTKASATAPASSGPSLDFNSLKVLEYKMTSVADGQSTSMNMRWEFGATDVHMKVTSDGTTVMDMTVPRDQASSSGSSSGTLGEAMSSDFTAKLTNVGTEVVTVPKGTYTCTKYTVKDNNAVSTYWIANNVPLPVKMTQSEDGKETMVMELVDYQV